MDLKDEINKIAYEIFIKSGCVPGRDMDNWLEAERIVIEKYTKFNTTNTTIEEKTSKIKKATTKTKKATAKAKTTTPKKKTESKKKPKQATEKEE